MLVVSNKEGDLEEAEALVVVALGVVAMEEVVFEVVDLEVVLGLGALVRLVLLGVYKR